MRITLILLLMLSVSHSINCIDNATDVILEEQGGIIILSLVFIALVLVIAYLAGTFTGNVNLIVFAKDEAWHFGFSVALLFGFSMVLLFSCSAVDLFYKTTLENIGAETDCYSESAELADVSICYLNSAKGDARRMSELYMDNYITYLRKSTWSVTISIPLLNSFTSAAGAWKRVVSNQYDLTLNMFVFPALLSLSMQELFLGFISDTIIYWLLPIAFILRVLPPTRGMGNMLIALSIGLYIIVPFIYTFNLAMYDVIGDDECLAYSGAVQDRWFGGCGEEGSFWSVARLIPQAFFLPNLTIALLVTFLAGVNKALRVIG